MIGTLIGIIIVLIIVGVLWWAFNTLLGVLPIAEPFRTVIYVLMVLVAVLIVIWIILQLLGAVGVHVPVFRF